MRGLDSIKVAVMVTTDKVYRNNEWLYPYRETDMLGGHDPYSASKAASENVIASCMATYKNRASPLLTLVLEINKYECMFP